MIAIVIHRSLVRVDDRLGERYAVIRPGDRATWDHTGRAVCPVTQASIDDELERVRRRSAQLAPPR